MLHKVRWLSVLVLTSVIVLLLPNPINADTEDGYYEIDYEVLNADNDSVSVANDYFDKPAVLIVDGDNRTLQLSINHSQWVVGLQAPKGDDFEEVEVLSEDKEDEEDEKRIVQFDIEDGHDFSEPVEMKMHIVVDVLEEDYDHEYTARFDFDEASMEEVDAPLFEVEDEESNDEGASESEESDDADVDEAKTDSATDEDAADEEKSGVNAVTMIVIVLLVGIAIILIYSFAFKKKK